MMKYKHTFICEYSKIERFNIYKAIKERLIYLGCFDIETVKNALNEKTVNIIEWLFGRNDFEIAYPNTTFYCNLFEKIL